MCGIVGVYNIKNAKEIALQIINTQQSRGQDSSGIAWLQNGEIKTFKKAIAPKEFIKSACSVQVKSNIVIGHNRHATSNLVEKNKDTEAHPFVSEDGSFAIVHNGVYRSHEDVRKVMQAMNHTFSSGVDSEVFVHVLEECFLKHKSEIVAFRNFFRIADGNIIILMKDGRMIGFPDTAFNVFKVDNGGVIISSEFGSILPIAGNFEEITLYDPDDGAFMMIDKGELKLFGDWDTQLVKSKDWLAVTHTSCDFCDGTGVAVQKYNGKDRCYKCYKEGKTESKVKAHTVSRSSSSPNSSYTEDAHFKCKICENEAPVQTGIFMTETTEFVCFDCFAKTKQQVPIAALPDVEIGGA